MVIEEEPFDPEMNEMPAVDPNVSVPSATESETTSDEPVDVASVALIVPTNVNKPFSFRLALAGALIAGGSTTWTATLADAVRLSPQSVSDNCSESTPR